MRLYPFNLQPAVRPMVIAWLVGTVSFFLGMWCQDAIHGISTPKDVNLFAMFVVVAFVTGIIGGVVFSSCIVLAMVVLRLAPHGSLLWRPPVATFVGMLTGLVVMELWASAYHGQLEVPHPDDSSVWIMGGVAAVVGGTFAGLFARKMSRLPSDLPPPLPGSGTGER